MPLPGLRKPEYAHQPGRYADAARIDALIQAETETQTTAHWLEKLGAARIPCAPVNDFSQALSDPQVLARDMVVEVGLQSGETIRMPGNPVKFDASGPQAFAAPPLLGEHTQAVLGDLLGYSDQMIRKLRDAGAIQ